MTSLGEVQRIIGLSLSKIQMGRNQRGGLPLHKNLLVATVLNKARDVYMQETMYMNYRLMACGQFNQEEHEDIEDDETPDAEDYEEDSESDVEDDNDSSASKDYSKEFVGPSCVGSLVPGVGASGLSQSSAKLEASAGPVTSPVSPVSPCCVTPVTTEAAETVTSEADTSLGHSGAPDTGLGQTSDEGFIDETDCDCDTRNFSEDGETRVPFQYCFSCAPFHPSNGRGPTLVGPNQQQVTHPCPAPQPIEQEDKLIYDMDLKSTQNQPSSVKRKRQISSEETEDAISSILPKKRRDSGGDNLDDSGYQEEEKVRTLYYLIFVSMTFINIFLRRSFTRHSVTGAWWPTAWRSIRSRVSSPSSPSASKCLPTPSPPRPPRKARRQPAAQKMRTTRTVIVTRAVTAVTLVMIRGRTMMTSQRRHHHHHRA